MEDLFGKIPILNILVNFYRVKGMALEAFKWVDGTKYIGGWKNGKIAGSGIFY